jgi:hypothetical protein
MNIEYYILPNEGVGKRHRYPADQTVKTAIENMTGLITITPVIERALGMLGHTFSQVEAPK